MAEFNDDTLYEMSDEELEAAFRAAKEESPEVGEDLDMEEEIAEEENDVIEEDEEVEYMEQPADDEDSDDDTSSDDEDEDESDEETDETDEDDADGQSEEDEDDTTEEEDEAKEEERPVQMHKFKANGREYEFSDDEIRQQFPKIFGQAMDYTKKMQAIKPWRKTIDAIESAQLGHDDVNLMIDVLKGDKGAIAEVLKRTGVDTLELETDENTYTPKDYGRDDAALNVKDVIDRISADPEYERTQKVLAKEWDDGSWSEMTKNPELMELLHIDIKSGMYDKVQPIAEKLKVYGRGAKSDLEYYKEAAVVYFEQLEQMQARQAKAGQVEAEKEAKKVEKARIAEVKAKQAKAKTVKQESAKRKAAAPTKKAAGRKGNINYLDDSDEAFEEWYSQLQDA